jgi:hypothetical protein
MRTPKNHLVITVEGGVADFVAQGCRNVSVSIIDWDNIEAGDEPNIERPKKGERGAIARLARRAWSMYDKAHKEEYT